MKMNVKGNDNFRTPQRLYDQLDKIFNFTLDAACTKEDCKAPRGLYHDEGVDALACSWGGNVYSAIHHLAKRLNLSQRHIMKLSTANAPLSLWCCLQTVRTAAPSRLCKTKRPGSNQDISDHREFDTGQTQRIYAND